VGGKAEVDGLQGGREGGRKEGRKDGNENFRRLRKKRERTK